MKHPRLLIASAGLTSLLMIVLLAFQLVTVERQRRIAARQEQRVISVLEATRPRAERLQDRVGSAIPALTGGLRRADDLVRALAREDAPAALAAAGELAIELTTGDRARILADRGNELLASLQDGDTLGDVEATTRAVVELLQITQELRDITSAAATDTDELREATIAFQNEVLGVQRETLGILQQSLEVQLETLERVRNIDERTGALAPEPVVP